MFVNSKKKKNVKTDYGIIFLIKLAKTMFAFKQF